VINDTSLNGTEIPFNPVYLYPDNYEIHYANIDLDKDSLIDARIKASLTWGGSYYYGSVTIESFNNFYVHVDTNFRTPMPYLTFSNIYLSRLVKVPVPEKYLINDTIYHDAYAWDSTEIIIGKISWTWDWYETTWIDIDHFEGDTTYIALTKSDGISNGIYYIKGYVYNHSRMNLYSIKTNDSIFINSHGCLPNGIVFTQQSQIDSFYYHFPFCSTVEGDMEITGAEITNLTGLSDLIAIRGNLIIQNTDSLLELTGLNHISNLGGSLHIKENSRLNNLEALSGIDSIGGDLLVENNNSLKTLSGLENINSSTINDLTICKNDSLAICDFPNICQYLSNSNGEVSIYENAPGCYNAEQLVGICDTTDIFDNVFWNSITLYPNPTKEVLQISFSTKIPITELNIYNPSGQLILKENQVSNLLNVSSLKPGVYIVELKLLGQIVRRKLIIK